MTGKSPPAFCPEWASEKRVSVVAIVCFAILVLLCFFIFIPVAVTMNQSDGNCFLYADLYGFGPTSVCSYCIVCAIIFLVLCSLRLGLLIYKISSASVPPVVETVSSFFSIWGVHLIIFVLDVCLLILLLVTACMLSAGLSHLCSSLFGSRSECSSEDGVLLPNGDVNDSFYQALTFAEGSAWCAFIFWLLVVIYETVIALKIDTFAPVVVRISSLKSVDKASSHAGTSSTHAGAASTHSGTAV